MQHIDLSVVLVNWNTRELLRACLHSLQKHPAAGRVTEIIVVDDASSDGSAEMLEAEFPYVQVLRNDRYQSFTISNNRGLAAARGDLLLCLNTDTEVHAGALDRLCDLAASRPDLGICSAMLLNTDGTRQGQYMNFWSALVVTAVVWQWWRIPALRPIVCSDRGSASAPRPCGDPTCPHHIVYTDSLDGACHLLRREVYERIGPQDERISIWCGDMDWCLRADKAGYRQAMLTCSRITHHGGGATKKNGVDTWQKTWGRYQGYVHFLRKHHGAAGVLGAKLAIGAYCAAGTAAQLPLMATPPLRDSARARVSKFGGALRRLPAW
jgi:GT2 family glycosyltransferase